MIKALAARRPIVTDVVEWEGRQWHVGVGLNPDGIAREIFADGVKTGTTIEALVDDACVMVSKLMQDGNHRAADVLAMLCAPPEPGSKYAPSLIAVFLSKAVEIEAECAR